MTKLYQVIHVHTYDYNASTTTPVFNSLDKDSAIREAMVLCEELFLEHNVYNFFEFYRYDQEFFKAFRDTCWRSEYRYYDCHNVYIVEVDLDQRVKTIGYHGGINRKYYDHVVWEINKEIAETLFVKKVVKMYSDNQIFLSKEEAHKLFHKIVQNPSAYKSNSNIIDQDANSEENIEAEHYFNKYEK